MVYLLGGSGPPPGGEGGVQMMGGDDGEPREKKGMKQMKILSPY